MHDAIIIKTISADVRTYEFGIGLEELKEGVGGGWIEMIRLRQPTDDKPGLDMYVDEEGLLKQLPFNPLATGVARFFGEYPHTLVGDAIVTGCMRSGDAVGLSAEDKRVILRVLQNVVTS